jgi:multidrug efflux system membrane fusion protein
VADGAKARLDEAETALSDTTLRSPLKGVVTKRSIEVGTLAGQSTVAFSLADTETVKVLFAVPDTALSHVKLGSMQNVTTESLKDVVFQGRISRVSPVADQKSRAFEVEVTIANADGRLKPGMVAALGLDVGAKTETADLMVPLAAVVRPPTQRDKFGVFVATEEGGKLLAKLRAVEVGEFAGNAVSVKGGLKGGEKVVVMGAGLLSDGDAIGVVE